MNCSKCGKLMIDERGVTGDFFQVVLQPLGFSVDFKKQQFGKYDPEKPYAFCVECVIDGLMGDS